MWLVYIMVVAVQDVKYVVGNVGLFNDIPYFWHSRK